MEGDNEVKGEGNSYTTEWRQYDPRIGRWLSLDPAMKKFPSWSPYVFSFNNPIWFNDPNGDEPPYEITNGVISGTNVVNDISKETERPKMKTITAIVIHRTVSSNANSAIKETKSHKGKTGFHAVIDKDGKLTQVNNLNNRANHVGKQKGEVGNNNSIGIEVVGNYNEKTKTWEPLTSEQIQNTAQLVVDIMSEYKLTINQVIPHEDASWKTEGEGKTVINAISNKVQEINTKNEDPNAALKRNEEKNSKHEDNKFLQEDQ